MKRIAWIIPLALTASLAACTHNVTVDPTPVFEAGPPANRALAENVAGLTFVRGTFTDQRPDQDRLAQFRQGIHTYNLHGKRPIGDALFDMIASVVSASGHEWTRDQGDVRVDIELLGIEAERHAGMINVGASARVQVRVVFVDPGTDRSIYSQVYNGTDEREQALIGTMNLVRASVRAAMADCGNSIALDEGLADALARR